MPDDLETYLQELLAPACEPLYTLLEDCTEVTDAHFQVYDIPPSHWFGRTHLTRAHLAHRLERHGLPGFALRDTRNNGRILLAAEDGSSVRLLHAGPKGSVPPPGTNAARIHYYRQHQLQIPNLLSSRLLALWTVDTAGQATIRVVRPAGRWKYGQKALVDADFLLPRTAAGMSDLEFVPDASDLELVLPPEEERTSPHEEAFRLEKADRPDDV